MRKDLPQGNVPKEYIAIHLNLGHVLLGKSLLSVFKSKAALNCRMMAAKAAIGLFVPRALSKVLCVLVISRMALVMVVCSLKLAAVCSSAVNGVNISTSMELSSLSMSLWVSGNDSVYSPKSSEPE